MTENYGYGTLTFLEFSLKHSLHQSSIFLSFTTFVILKSLRISILILGYIGNLTRNLGEMQFPSIMVGHSQLQDNKAKQEDVIWLGLVE